MSLNIISHKVREFLQTSTPEVLMIKGSWGIGKSYFWNQFLQEQIASHSIALPKYSYVSLFGIRTLEALKWQIFERTVPIHSGFQTPNVSSLAKNVAIVVQEFDHDFCTTKDCLLSGEKLLPLLKTLVNIAVRDTIICIEDMERRGDSLDAAEIFGLVSFLKEQQNCKIIFLINESKDKDKGKGVDFGQFKDKVIDAEITLLLTPEECAKIALPGEAAIEKMARGYCVYLKLSNMRVIHKIYAFLMKIYPLIKNINPEIQRQVVRSTVLFFWGTYSQREGAIPVNYMLDYKSRLKEVPRHSHETQILKQWTEISDKYLEFHLFDHLDLCLSEAIESGVIDYDKLAVLIKEKQRQIVKTSGLATVSKKLTNIFYESFDNNQDDIVDHMYSTAVEYMEVLTEDSLDKICILLSRLNALDKVDELKRLYMETHPNIATASLEANISENTMQSAEQQLATRLLNIAEKKSWDIADEQYLADQPYEMYVTVLKNQRAEALRSILNACLMLTQFTPTDNWQILINQHIIKAVQAIAKESDINRLRLSGLGFASHLNAHTEESSAQKI